MRTRLASLGLAAALVACSSSGSQPGDAGTSSSDAETDGPATTLFMPGIWTITFSLASAPDAATSTSDSAVFTFCVAG